MTRRRWFEIGLCLMALGISHVVSAQELRRFTAGSYDRIVQAHAGKPFVLAVWSLTCEPCREELELFSGFLQKNPQFELVLIATDTPADEPALRAALARHRIARAEIWVFADAFQEKLRFEIDRRWYGELPRTYFFNAAGVRQGVSGKLDAGRIDAWFAAK